MRVEIAWVATSVYNSFAYFAPPKLGPGTLLLVPVYGRKSSAISRDCLLKSLVQSHAKRVQPRSNQGILELWHR